MRLRSANTPAPWSWSIFPAELRTMILQAIANQKNTGWGSHAAVCKEWQQFLEPLNFGKLKLRVPCLDDFPHVVAKESSKRLLVRHICLNIELPRYTSTCCSKTRAKTTNRGEIVDLALKKLFSILSQWKREGDLTLELNVYSPSDSEHWFKNIYLSSDNINDSATSNPISDIWRNGIPYHDLEHGWDNGRQRRYAPESSVKQLFRPIQLKHYRGPQVTAVTCFVMRRQLRRCISPEGASSIFRRLEDLEAIWYEPWEPYKDVVAEARECHDYIHSICLKAGISPTVKSLIVFEDSYCFYNQFGERPAQVPYVSLDDLDPELGETFAIKSLKLQNLAVAFLVAAEQVFEKCNPTWRWPYLQSLALTSPSLRPYQCDEIETLLCRAAQLVPNMAHLHTLVLWNGGKANACAFIFHRSSTNKAWITWRGNWLFDWTPRILACWGRVATALGLDILDTKRELIEADINSHGDAIHHLHLPCTVITPESLWQIRREAYTVDG